jgi:hypothetical protein
MYKWNVALDITVNIIPLTAAKKNTINTILVIVLKN